MDKEIAQILYNPERDRLTFLDEDIHCGDELEVLLADGTWQAVSFEYSTRWYIPQLKKVLPVGLWARKIK